MPLQEDTTSARVDKPKRQLRAKGKRALRACDSCRRLKTRCIPSPLPNEIQCLRCDSLKLRCSFQDLLENSGSPGDAPTSKIADGPLAESAEWTKTLLKSGYTPADFAITSKLLQSINTNVIHVLSLLQSNPAAAAAAAAGGTPEHVHPHHDHRATNGNRHAIDSALIDAVKMMASTSSQTLVPTTTSSSARNTPTPIQHNSANPGLNSLSTTELRHFSPYLSSPFAVISQLVGKENLPLPVRKLLEHGFNEGEHELADDIVALNYITIEEAILLMQDFRDRYGAWCSFPETISTDKLVNNIRSRGCSLLLTVSCVLALRYTTKHYDMKTRIYKNLLYKLKSDLETSLKTIPQSIEFVQAIVILSIYASSFSSDILAVDAWYISGIGLQQYLTRSVADTLTTYRDRDTSPSSELDDLLFGIGTSISHADGGDENKDGNLSPRNIFEESSEFERLSSFRLWNHLCLVHITHCVFSGRMCVIDEVRLDLCRRTLELSNSTNFDGRMVAEISLQLIIYNFMQQCNNIDISSKNNPLDVVHGELHQWLEEWGYLFSQPITQFVEFTYHYGYAMISYIWYHRCYKLARQQLKLAAPAATTNSSDVTDTAGTTTISSTPTPASSGSYKTTKTFIGKYLNQTYPVDNIINAMPQEKRLEMLQHCHRALETMVDTDFDSFRYLSDQLFFSCMHSSLLCLVIAHNLYHMKNSAFPESQLEDVLTDVKKFSLRLQKIREGELKSFWVEEVDLKIPSVILQYHKSIEGCLQEKFPEYEITVDENDL